jgi:hypothetical protein
MMSEETALEGLEPGETPVAWTAMPYRAPVLSADGALLGTAESLLGDDATDIFHEIAADRVERITTRRVDTDLTGEEAGRLEPYDDDKPWYRLDWGGLFRKRPDWVEPQ